MTKLTITLPDNLLQQLKELAQKLSLSENQVVEHALKIYLDQLNIAEFTRSFQKASDDPDILAIAEEGMNSYLMQLL